jgi:diaminopimelate epimerase
MHGTGNVMQVIDCLGWSAAQLEALEPYLPSMAIDLLATNPLFGGDQFVLVLPPPDARLSKGLQCDLTMRFFNSDGSEGDLCGNGLRCFYKYAIDRKLTPATIASEPSLRVWSPRTGIVNGTVHTQHPKNDAQTTWVTVTLGTPKVVEPQIFLQAKSVKSGEDRSFTATHVNMGNPNCVILFAQNEPLDDDLVKGFGPSLERHDHFPKRTNVEFVKVESQSSVRMRVWERGSGETLSCGSGACAVVTAAITQGWVSSSTVVVHVPGGELVISLDPDTGLITKLGPAVTVAAQQYTLPERN